MPRPAVGAIAITIATVIAVPGFWWVLVSKFLFVGCMCYHDIDGTVTLFIVWVFLSSCPGGDKRLS